MKVSYLYKPNILFVQNTNRTKPRTGTRGTGSKHVNSDQNFRDYLRRVSHAVSPALLGDIAAVIGKQYSLEPGYLNRSLIVIIDEAGDHGLPRHSQ